jgi:general secretion pathway protein K
MRTLLPHRSGLQRQRGIALITAVLIVALATILAIQVGFNGYLDQRRGATAFALDQGFEVAVGAEAWAADILIQDKKQSKGATNDVDDFTEAWATPIPPIPIDGGEVQGQLEDMQGRFNLNNLVKVDQSGKLVAEPNAEKRLRRLLKIVGLEEKWASAIVDWIDTDLQPDGNDGAEDSVYSSLAPPYRTPNMPITRSSELLAIAGFGLERFQKLEPFVTALPIGTKINTCTAPFEVLDSMLDHQEWNLARQSNTEARKQRCFPTEKEFKASLTSQAEKDELGDSVSQNSSYFRASIWVTIGTTQFTLYSLLKRDNTQVRPILRSFGTA